jgi:hypothetical protein
MSAARVACCQRLPSDLSQAGPKMYLDELIARAMRISSRRRCLANQLDADRPR